MQATAPSATYPLSLHDALPIWNFQMRILCPPRPQRSEAKNTGPWLSSRIHHALHDQQRSTHSRDRKSTRLNSSHANISYAVFCLKKKKTQLRTPDQPNPHTNVA